MLYYIQYKQDRYLRQDKDGSFTYVGKTVVATQFTREIANKIINNQIKFCDRKYHKLVEVGTETMDSNTTTNPELTVSNKLTSRIDLMVDGLASLSSLCKQLPEEERFRFCPRCGEYLGGPVQMNGPSAYNNQQRLADVLFPRIIGNWGQMAREFDQLGITIPPVLPGKHVWARIGKHAVRHTVDLVRLTMIPIDGNSDFIYGWEIRCREDGSGRSADFTERDFGDEVFLTMQECQKQIEEEAE